SAYLIEQLGQPLSQRGDLDLLERDARDPLAALRLQEERALPRLPDSARDEPLGLVECEDLARHDSTLCGGLPRATADDGVRRGLAPAGALLRWQQVVDASTRVVDAQHERTQLGVL